MSGLDAAVLGGVLLLAALAWRAEMPPAWRRALRGALGLAAVGCAVQAFVEGAYWQFGLVYALLVALAVRAFGTRPTPTRRLRAGIAALALLAVAPWMVLLPVPSLPAPSGPYEVGTEVFRWVDDRRPEMATDAPEDKRNVVVQAWYPAAAGARGPHAPYIDGLGRLPKFVYMIPGWLMAHYDRIDTHAVVAAPLAEGAKQWPVVLFSPGYGSPRAFYSGLLADLASRGFVVLALDHPYEVAITELADGRLATPIEHFLPDDPGMTKYMVQHAELRAADVRFVLDRIAQPDAANVLGARLGGHLDLDHVAAIGHSFGGAAAVLATSQDARIDAAVNMDGTLDGPLPDLRLARPLLLLESDHAETGHAPEYLEGNQRLLHHLQAAGYRFEIATANHYSFLDAPLFLSPPARFALSMAIGGSRGPEDTQRAANDILAAFLATSMGLAPARIDAAAARHAKIQGGMAQTPP